MSVRLVSSNDSPRTVTYPEWIFIDAKHEAEWHQIEQSEANTIASLWFAIIAAFLAGVMATAIAWMLVG